MDRVETPIDYQIHTFGCKVNTYDSGKIADWMNREQTAKSTSKTEAFFRDNSKVHILNSCAVTAEATLEALRLARRLKRKDPNCKVVVTGCSAQVDSTKLEAENAIDLIVANSHKSSMKALVQSALEGSLSERIFKSNIFKKEDLEPGGGVEQGHSRSFLKIQDGCNSFCTFCVIPFARGKSRSAGDLFHC